MLAPGLVEPADIVVTKRQLGAFTGTELDTVLRRRRMRTVVVCSIATNFSVESTARHAWELGYDVVVAEDCCSSLSAELHAMAVGHVLPHVARVVRGSEIEFGQG